jgi:hypothetical protein
MTNHIYGPQLMDRDADTPVPCVLAGSTRDLAVELLDTFVSPWQADRPLLATVRYPSGTVSTVPFAWLLFDRAPLSGLRRIPGSLRHA